MLHWQNHIRLILISCLAISFGTPCDVAANPNEQLSIAFNKATWVTDLTARIPFQFAGRLPMIEAQIDGKLGNFIFDTGAADLILNSNHFEGSNSITAGIHASSTGQVELLGRKWIDSTLIDEVIVQNLRADLINLGHLEESKRMRILGIIGYSVLKDFEVFIDYPYRQIILTRINRNGTRLHQVGIPEVPSDSMSFALHRHAIIMKGQVNGRTLRFNLDTGAEVNLLDNRVHKDVLHRFEIIRHATLLGVGDTKIDVLAGKLDGVHCGVGRTYPMRTLLTDTDYIMNMTDTRVDGVLGYEYLYTKRISINYKTKMIYFYKHAILKP